MPLSGHRIFGHCGKISSERFKDLAAVVPNFLDYGITVHCHLFQTTHQECI